MSNDSLRVALVTGGSGGIGRAVAERLAHDGFAVGVHYSANKARAEETAAAVTSAGGRAIAVAGEGKDHTTIDNLAKAAPMERLGAPQDIAEVVAFLAGPARWINGQTVFANGGLA
ncbi:SDR family oxidoreductase [Sinosporangium siamense]|uniref:SDR family oxidoreductase n=1 Tax=Sinosporangium siamense TaxID=1367973 RepID=A0A919RHY9_9ACTN|nr:SDR family oxidoreductase [Sinosporangium siamense]GII94168.1 hypothetical protein Ssi02_43990 [Sinosporangium siamense]